MLYAHYEGIDGQQLAEDADFSEMVASLKYLKGNFRRQERPEGYLFSSLALMQRTSEKQSASPLDLLSTFGEATRLRRSTGKALRDVLGQCVAEFNRSVVKAGFFQQ